MPEILAEPDQVHVFNKNLMFYGLCFVHSNIQYHEIIELHVVSKDNFVGYELFLIGSS